MSRPATVVLAAGMGKRMQSDLPKVLHRFAGSTIIDFVLNVVESLHPARSILVIGHQADGRSVNPNACVEPRTA